MGKSYSIELQEDLLSPETFKMIEALKSVGTLNLFVNKLIEQKISEHNTGESHLNQPVLQNNEKMFEVLLDIREALFNLSDNIYSLPTKLPQTVSIIQEQSPEIVPIKTSTCVKAKVKPLEFKGTTSTISALKKLRG